MAIIGNITSASGAVADYHNIRFYTWDKYTNITVQISSYVDALSRDSGKQPLMTTNLSFVNDGSNILSLAGLYVRIMALPQFINLTSDV